MDTSKPLVTINIVTRNRAEPLRNAIESAYAQTYRPIEIVVVDNDSSDGSPDMVAQRWPDIRLIRLHMNIGCQPGRNIGMKNSRGKYIFNLDDDGALESTAIERLAARFESEPDLALISAAIKPMHEERAHLIRERVCEAPRYVSGFPGGASAIRREVLDKTGYFPEYPRGHAEADLALRILDKRYEMYFMPDVIMYHDVCDIERVKNNVTYWEVRHRLETRFRLEPWRRCLPNAAWKLATEFVTALRKGTLPGYAAGVIHFVYDLPRILWTRKPVSIWAVQKTDYLVYNYVTDGAKARGFERFSFWQMLRNKVRAKHLQLKPNNDT